MSSTASKLRISGIEPESIVDGPGFRYTIFVQGCPHGCHGCHNPDTHPFDGGRLVALPELLKSFDENPLLAGMTFSGGEPFCQPGPLADLADEVHARGKDVVIYSGYTLEELRALAVKDPAVKRLLLCCDLLIDGPYVEAQRNLTLLFRGSANQRMISREEINQQ